MLEKYYKGFFPTPERDKVMKQQILLSEYINGYTPDVTDDMEYADFIDWYNKAVDLYSEDEEDGTG